MGLKIAVLSESSTGLERSLGGRSAGRCRARASQAIFRGSDGLAWPIVSGYKPGKSRQPPRATFSHFFHGCPQFGPPTLHLTGSVRRARTTSPSDPLHPGGRGHSTFISSSIGPRMLMPASATRCTAPACCSCVLCEYMVAIMDWASRRVLSWRLSNTMDIELCLEALTDALERFGVAEVFNTDSENHVAGSPASRSRLRCRTPACGA